MVRSKQLELVDLGFIGSSLGVKENTDIEGGNIVKEMDQNQNLRNRNQNRNQGDRRTTYISIYIYIVSFTDAL